MAILPLFSLIVPIYKVEDYLPQCIESLLSQNYDNYEIILIDDGSPDRCPEICDIYAAKYSHIKVIHKPNGGLSDARNKGIEIATGEYITFIDSDDFWKGTGILKEITDIVLEYQPDIIVSDIIKYYSKEDKYIYPSKICSRTYNKQSKLEILNYLYFNHADLKISACQKFIHRDILSQCLFTLGLLSEDIDWSLKLYSKVKKICLYDKPYYCYRQMREGSITTTASQRSFNSLIFIIKKWRQIIPTLNITKEEKDIYLGYLAYQLSITMLLYNNLPKIVRKKANQEIKNNLILFSNTLNNKTKKVKLLLSFLGLSNTYKFLYLFKYIKNKLLFI